MDDFKSFIDGTSEDKARYSTLREVFKKTYEQGYFLHIIFLKKEAKFDLNFFNKKYFIFYEKYLNIFTPFITSLKSIINDEKDFTKKIYYEVAYQKIQKMALVNSFPRSFFKTLILYSFLDHLMKELTVIDKTNQTSFDINILTYNKKLNQYENDLKKSFLKKILTQFHLIKSPEEKISNEINEKLKTFFIMNFNDLLPNFEDNNENNITFLIKMSLIYSPRAEEDISDFFSTL